MPRLFAVVALEGSQTLGYAMGEDEQDAWWTAFYEGKYCDFFTIPARILFAGGDTVETVQVVTTADKTLFVGSSAHDAAMVLTEAHKSQDPKPLVWATHRMHLDEQGTWIATTLSPKRFHIELGGQGPIHVHMSQRSA